MLVLSLSPQICRFVTVDVFLSVMTPVASVPGDSLESPISLVFEAVGCPEISVFFWVQENSLRFSWFILFHCKDGSYDFTAL